MFEGACREAIASHSIHETTHQRFIDTIESEMRRLFASLVKREKTTFAIHSQEYSTLRPYIRQLKSHRSCLACLMHMPEKVLCCGHAICDVCLKVHGQKSPEGGYSFVVEDCPICGVTSGQTFRLIPPTAGIRLLSIDGGGIRGIVPIIFLRYLETRLSRLGCPLSEYFDLVCGTSAGMIPSPCTSDRN